MFKFLSLLLQQYHKPHIGWHGGLFVPSRQSLYKDLSWLRESRKAMTIDRRADRHLFFFFLIPICQHDVSGHGIMSDRNSYQVSALYTNLNTSQLTMNGRELASIVWLVFRDLLHQPYMGIF